MTSFALEPMFDSLVLACAVAVAVIAVIWLVTPPTTSPRQRWILFAFRSAAALVLLLAAFRPTLVRSDRRPADAALVIAVDVSRSMTLPDGQGGDRWSQQQKAFRELASGLEGSDHSLDVQVIAYAAQTQVLPRATPDALNDLKPDGELTDLQAAATSAIESAAGKPIAGIVLMGDGTQTATVRGGGPLRVAETLDSLGIPLWTVPIGPTGDAEASRDVAIEALPESFQLFTGNEVEIPFAVATRGLAGLSVPIRIVWIDSEGERTVAAERTANPQKALDSLAMSIPTTAPAPGNYRLVVEADPQSGELITANNAQVAFAEVREGGGRILYLEGQPRLEQAFIRRALSRFPDLDLTYRWVPADTSSRWPTDLEHLLRPGRFDAFVLGDLDAAALGTEQLATLRERIAEGAGLVTLGGYRAYERGGYAATPLADAIPVKLDPSIPRAPVPADRAASGASLEGQLEGPVELRPVQSHPLTQLGDGGTSKWESLPPQLGANRFAGPKIAPGVQVLLESANEDPLLVVGEYGRGRVASLAFDSTYRWWRSGDDESHRRFWRQLMLWLLDRDTGGDDVITAQLEARRFPTDASPGFSASISYSDEPGQPLQWTAEVVSETGEVTPVDVIVQEEGASARGKLPRLPAGLYQLRIRDASPGTRVEPAEIGFQVIDESRELERPMADPVYLRQLADVTRAHGGAAFRPDQIDSLVDEITERRRRAEVPVVEKYRLGDGPVSGWIVFLLFAVAMTGEWILRRRWSLP